MKLTKQSKNYFKMAEKKKTPVKKETTTKKVATTKKTTTPVKKVSEPKKTSEPKVQEELVERIFLNKESKVLLERGKFPKSLVESQPTLYFKNTIDAQSNARHYVDEIKHKLKKEEVDHLLFIIQQFS